MLSVKKPNHKYYFQNSFSFNCSPIIHTLVLLSNKILEKFPKCEITPAMFMRGTEEAPKELEVGLQLRDNNSDLVRRSVYFLSFLKTIITAQQ